MFRAVVFVVLLSHVLADKYVYIVSDLAHVPCINNPAPALCTLDYKVPDFSAYKGDESISYTVNETTLNHSINIVLGIWGQLVNVSDQCKSALTGYMCAASFPVCQDDTNTITVHGQKAQDACTKVSQDCAGMPNLSTIANCSALVKRTLPKGAMCEDLPAIKDDPYPCSGGMYGEKYLVDTNQNLTSTVLQFHGYVMLAHEDESCKKNVSDAICKRYFLGCTKDKKKAVSFMSREQCFDAIACVDEAIVKQLNFGHHDVCGHLPSANDTAAKLSIFDAFGYNTTEGSGNTTDNEGSGDGSGDDTGSGSMIISQLSMMLVVFITLVI